MNLLETLLLSRKDWNQSNFRNLVYSLITEEDLLLNEYELKYKIEGIECGLKYPHIYDKYGNKLNVENVSIKSEPISFDRNQYFISDKKIKNIF